MYERFTEAARQVVVLAQDEVRRAQHGAIDVPHLLLGMVREEEGVAARALENLGVGPEAARMALLKRIPPADEPPADQIPVTPEAKATLELALREALSLGANFIGTEHLLLSAARSDGRENDAFLRRDLGLDPEAVRNEVIRILGAPLPRRAQPPQEAAEEEPPTPLESIPTHSDRPATKDELGRVRLAEVLGERMRRVRGEDTETPVRSARERREKRHRDSRAARAAGSFMIHIHAPWGAGKSSLLNFLARDLRNRGADHDSRLSQWIVVDFSAWEHQRLEPPWWWLLAAIRRSAVRELWQTSRGRWAWFLVRDVAWRLWNSRTTIVTLALLVALVLVARALDWFGLSGTSLTAVKTTLLTASAVAALAATVWGHIRGTSEWIALGSAAGAERFLKRAHDPLGAYRRRFRWLVRSAGHPIAVFVEDLDRCKPEYVVALIEGIQTLFADEPVTYVVAADRTWVCESFAKAYGDFADNVGELGRPLGYLFLEKTFQISMEIPPMTWEERTGFWSTLMKVEAVASEVSGDGSPEPLAADAFAGVQTQNELERRMERLRESGADEEQLRRGAMRKSNSPELQAELEQLLGEFAPLLENNPRAMKRLLNGYGIERDRLLRSGRLPSQRERRQLVLFTILRMRWPRFADHLLRHPGDAKLLLDPRDLVGGDHPYRSLFAEPDIRKLFDGSFGKAKLDEALLRRYAGHEPEDRPSVGA